MSKLNKNLIYSLKWLSLESITYHAIFLAHQTMLIKFAGLKLYGIISVIFSAIYFATTISTFGLEASLSPYFTIITKSKNIFKKFFFVQFIPIILISIAYLPFLGFLKNKELLISPVLMLTIFILIISESIKKPLRAILYLSLKNKINMTTEIISLIIYTFSIWVIYAFTNTITLDLVFIPLAITSFATTILLLFYVYKIYSVLPNNKIFPESKNSCIYNIYNIYSYIYNTCYKLLNKILFYKKNNSDQNVKFNNLQINSLQIKIFKTRAINFASQFTHNMFSSNFLVPFFAMQFGLEQAGVFKLLSHITYTITMIMRKIFGWACDTLLAQTKNSKLAEKQEIFHSITDKINNIMLAITIFLSINLTKIIRLYGSYSSYYNTGTSSGACSGISSVQIINWQLIFFFLAATLIENLFISYEKFYIVEEKNSIILITNILSLILLSGIVFYAPQIGQTKILLLITIVRIINFTILAIISYLKWRIKPKIRLNPIYLGASILASIIFLKLF